MPDVERALAEQQEIDAKIVYARTKTPAPPGVPLTGQYRDIIGGHSGRILTDPNYQIISQTANADGTVWAKFRKLLSAGPPPVWSTTKGSTLAPAAWADNDIFRATERIGSNRVWRSDATKSAFVGTYKGCRWEVIKNASGEVTGSFPLGNGRPVF